MRLENTTTVNFKLTNPKYGSGDWPLKGIVTRAEMIEGNNIRLDTVFGYGTYRNKLYDFYNGGCYATVVENSISHDDLFGTSTRWTHLSAPINTDVCRYGVDGPDYEGDFLRRVAFGLAEATIRLSNLRGSLPEGTISFVDGMGSLWLEHEDSGYRRFIAEL